MGLPKLQESTLSHNINLASNLLNLMEKERVSDSDLARALNLPYNTIKRISSGETTDPKLSTLTLIADYFKIGIDSLLHGNASPFLSTERPLSVPILTWDDISNTELASKINLSQWPNWQPVAPSGALQLGPHAYAIKSRKSMEPRFPTGTTFIVDPDERPHDGDVILVKILATNEVTLRELEIDPPIWQLCSISGSLPALQLDSNKHRIMGVSVLTIFQSRD